MLLSYMIRGDFSDFFYNNIEALNKIEMSFISDGYHRKIDVIIKWAGAPETS